MSVLEEAIRDVVEGGNCTGCGACAAMFGRVSMVLSAAGYMRPVVAPVRATNGEVSTFRRVCPGVGLTAPTSGARNDPIFGRFEQVWEGWAVDDDTRHRGSSAGVITALTNWLLETTGSNEVLGAAKSETDPRRTVPVRITTREEALAAAGSRYAPVSVLAALADGRRPDAIVGKPCEVSAYAQMASAEIASSEPLLISFFCAGTPSQHTTDELASAISTSGDITDLWYRGRGWPGRFSTVGSGGRTDSMSYEDSWGKHLGRSVQWRCKVCVDGTGAHADISVGDFWSADERGFPIFVEGRGNSVVIARSKRGADVIQRAVRDGVIAVRPLDLSEVARVQPLQVERKEMLAARLIGRMLARKPVPNYRGYRLWLGLLSHPVRSLRSGLGTYRRSRGAGTAGFDDA